MHIWGMKSGGSLGPLESKEVSRIFFKESS